MTRPGVNPDARTGLERSVRRRLLEIPDVMEGEAIFGDRTRTTAFFVDGTQIANLRDTNSLALRLRRANISAMRSELKGDPRIVHIKGDWIGVQFLRRADIDFVVRLAERAAEAHRPDGRPAKPPPAGPDLERRQRFH